MIRPVRKIIKRPSGAFGESYLYADRFWLIWPSPCSGADRGFAVACGWPGGTSSYLGCGGDECFWPWHGTFFRLFHSGSTSHYSGQRGTSGDFRYVCVRSSLAGNVCYRCHCIVCYDEKGYEEQGSGCGKRDQYRICRI